MLANTEVGKYLLTQEATREAVREVGSHSLTSSCGFPMAATTKNLGGLEQMYSLILLEARSLNQGVSRSVFPLGENPFLASSSF